MSEEVKTAWNEIVSDAQSSTKSINVGSTKRRKAILYVDQRIKELEEGISRVLTWSIDIELPPDMVDKLKELLNK